MKDRKRNLSTFSFYDYTGIEKRLEKMALKGWLIENLSGGFWRYKKITPAKLKFSVIYFAKSSEFDPAPNESEKTFHAFCKRTGWKLACSRGQLHIFYNENINPVPIETDPILHIESMHKAVKKSYIPLYFMLLAIAVLQTLIFASRIKSDTLGFLSDPTYLFSGLSWIIVLILCAADLSGYYIWRHKAKKAAQQNEFLPTKGHEKLSLSALFIVIAAFVHWLFVMFSNGSPLLKMATILMVLYIGFLIALVNGIKLFLKRHNAPRSLNRAITIISSFVLSFAMMAAITIGIIHAYNNNMISNESSVSGNILSKYLEEPPLTVSELYGVSMENYICERTGSESMFLAEFETHQYAEQYSEGLEYKIYIPKAPLVYEICKKSLSEKRDVTIADSEAVFTSYYKPAEDGRWNTKEVYRWIRDGEYSNKYLLIYENSIVEIVFSSAPTDDQIERVSAEFAK